MWKWLPHHILIGEETDIITTKHHRIENYDVILFYSLYMKRNRVVSWNGLGGACHVLLCFILYAILGEIQILII